MITLGMELFDTINALMTEGVSVSCIEVRSKKGVSGGVPRVIRITRTRDAVQVAFSFFVCNPNSLDAPHLFNEESLS